MKLLAGAAVLLGIAIPVAADAAGARPADGCATYQAEADAIRPDLNRALDLMHAHDIPTAARMLPALEAQLARVPAAMPAPQPCGFAVKVFDHHQYLRFDALQKAGKPVPGFPAGTRFVEATLPFANLAYAVGWLHREAGDFAGARAAFTKGLAIAPGDHNLTSELVGTLLVVQAWAEALHVLDDFLGSDTDQDAPGRASLIAARAWCQLSLGDRIGARLTLARALALDPANDQAKAVLARLQ